MLLGNEFAFSYRTESQRLGCIEAGERPQYAGSRRSGQPIQFGLYEDCSIIIMQEKA